MSWFQSLKRQIKWQLMVQLCTAFYYYPFKVYYEQHYIPALIQNDDDATIDEPIENKTRNRQEKATRSSILAWIVAFLLDSRYHLPKKVPEVDTGLPPYPAIFNYYHIFSTIYMIYVVLRNILKYGIALLGLNMPIKCYLPGHFSLFLLETNRFGFLLALYHLIWRFLWHYFPRIKLRSDLILFLLQEDEMLDRQYQLAGQSYSSEQNPLISRQDRFIRSFMYYEVKHTTKTIYRLRPNRTRSAKRQLVTAISKCFIFSLVVFFISFCLIFPPCFYTVFDDKHYLKTYPGCYPEMERWNREGQLEGFWTVTLTNHRLYSIVFDVTEHVIIWMDSGAALTLVMTIAYNLNFDVLLYLSYLQKHLEEALYRLRLEKAILEEEEAELSASDDTRVIRRENNKSMKVSHSDKWSESQSTSNNSGQLKTTKSLMVPPVKLSQNPNRLLDLSNLVFEIQAETFDFFFQIEIVDVMVSDLMTTASFIWTVTFALVTYYSLVNNKMPLLELLGPKFIQILGFLTFSLSSFFLLQLQSRTSRLYKTLSSLMAYDKSENKRRFTEVLEFYKGHNCSTYTLLHLFPFYATTYLTIVGWSISCFIIVEKLFRDPEFPQ